MKDRIYIYEDDEYKNFLPLVWLRPVFDLYCGMYTFRERIQKLYPEAKICEWSRFEHQNIRPSEYQTFINGRAILYSPLPDKEGLFVAQNEVLGFKVKSKKLKVKSLECPIRIKFLDSFELKRIEVKATVIKYPWNLIKENEPTLIKDFELLKTKKQQDLWIGENTKLEEGVFLRGKPIYIGNNVHITPPTIIEGPCSVGQHTIIDGAKIRPGTTIGKNCKIGGELEKSIISDHSNKHHEGFIGHSFIGEWVNLGAGTTTSDLKNTYGTVKVPSFQNRKHLNSKLLKLGSFIGDHTKTGIGTLLNTGSVLGCFVNIHGGGVAPKYIPSFTWKNQNEFIEYRLDKAIEVAKRVMTRRKLKLTKEYKERISKTFSSTNLERKKILKKL